MVIKFWVRFLCITLMMNSGLEVVCQSFVNQIKGARLNGLANQGAATKGMESWCINPSSLGLNPSTAVLFAGESRFVGTGIQGSSFIGSLSINPSSSIGAGIEFYGLPSFHQQSYKLGYGRLFSPTWSIGSSFQYIQFFNSSGENQSLQILTLGSLYDLNEQIGIGGSVNIPFTSAGLNDYYAFPSVQIGLRYSISNPVSIYTEVSKAYGFAWDYKLAVEYQLIHILALRLGVSTLSNSFSTGLSFKLQKKMSLDIASVFYQGIGLTPSLSLKYTFIEPKKESE